MFLDPEATTANSPTQTIEVWSLDQFKTALIEHKIARVHINPTAQIWYDNVLCHVLANRCTFGIFMAVIMRHKNGSFSRILAIAIRAHSLLQRRL